MPPTGAATDADHGHRGPTWAVLSLICLAQFMVVLDVSIVNVALPSIRADLHFSQTGLQWVVNTYAIAFAGFLLLGGRAADLFGHRRMFVFGMGLFTLASLAGGLAQDDTTLLIARAAQGLGGAVLSPATLTILTTTFTDPHSRSRALGLWSALAGAGGAAGALLGGALTEISWRWIFFVNLPIGVAGLVAAVLILSHDPAARTKEPLDVLGSLLVTAGLLLFVYGVVSTESRGWGSAYSLGAMAGGVTLLLWFVGHEARVAKAPLVPLTLFRSRSVTGANLTMFCIGGAIFASWFFLSLFMQGVLGYSPMRTGLAFLPQTLAVITGAQVSSRLVTRLGPRSILMVAPLISAVGLFWLSRLDADAHYWANLFVPSVLVTLGMGLSFTPVAFAATADIPRQLAGLASGLVNTTRQVGGALGLAVLATLATIRTSQVADEHSPAALTSGYDRAFLIASGIAVLAALSATVLPSRPRRAPSPAVVHATYGRA
jgi:EmrB/QacA subfamily drug resistance transporter